MNVIPVILAGGAGTRLWPLSRDEKPKQFHNLSGDGTLLEETIKRLLPLDPEQIVIVTSKKHLDLSREELGKFTVPGTVLAEPRPRNTAAALLYAALYLGKLFDDSIMISLPADHHILNTGRVRADPPRGDPAGGGQPARHHRHQAHIPGNGIRLHKGGRRETARSFPSTPSSKSQISTARGSISNQATTTGTAAYSYGRPRS